MNLEETVLELEAQILEAAGRLDEDVDAGLKELAGRILSDMRAGGFENRTGALSSSMFASVEDRQLSVGMLFYGYFLSFGVLPRQAQGLPTEVAQQFGVKDGYKFARRSGGGRFKKGGIAARGFYPDDILDRFESILATAIQKLEL